MPSRYVGKIQITPSVLRKYNSTIEVSMPRQEIRVTMHWRVWVGMRLIWLGAFIAGMGYKTTDDDDND